jgi:hypothetical protein
LSIKADRSEVHDRGGTAQYIHTIPKVFQRFVHIPCVAIELHDKPKGHGDERDKNIRNAERDNKIITYRPKIMERVEACTHHKVPSECKYDENPRENRSDDVRYSWVEATYMAMACSIRYVDKSIHGCL